MLNGNKTTSPLNSTESIKKRLSSGAFFKLEESVEEELIKNLKKNNNSSHDEQGFTGYNNIESIVGTSTGSRCVCNATETDADCCNSEIELGQILNCNGNVNVGSSVAGICNNDPEKNKLISIRGDFLGNINVNKNEQQSILNKRNNEISNTCRNTRLANGNWVLTKFCCGGDRQQQDSPKFSNNGDKPVCFSPSPPCEHVRPADTHKKHSNKRYASKPPCPSSLCASSSTTRQLLPSAEFQTQHDCCDYTSHLARLRETKTFTNCNLKSNKKQLLPERDLSFVLRQNNKISCLPMKNEFLNSQLYHQLQQQNCMNQIEFNNASLSSGNEIFKLNLNMQKLVKIEELFVKEKILRDEWKRKARVCDGICCLFVFFLLIVCSSFIFIILPNVKTSSLMD